MKGTNEKTWMSKSCAKLRIVLSRSKSRDPTFDQLATYILILAPLLTHLATASNDTINLCTLDVCGLVEGIILAGILCFDS